MFKTILSQENLPMTLVGVLVALAWLSLISVLIANA
jgi:hypothetical protein